MDKKTALVAGATGLVGRELLRVLLDIDYYSKIVVLTRRELDIKDNRLEVVIVEDFDFLDDHVTHLNVHHFYCLLGTTMKKAGSKENFRKIDHDYPLQLAKLAREQPNFEHFLLVTSLGANSSSMIFYNRVKGEVEESISDLGLASLKIFRPSLLIGFREEFRLGEEIGKYISSFLSFFMIGSRQQLFTIEGKQVAEAMFQVARSHYQSKEVFTSADIIRIAKDLESSFTKSR